MLEPGQQPADFVLPDQAGAPIAWHSLRGRPVVVFFYPKASTPGCTQEACDFRDLRATFEALGVGVIGASADAPRAQAKFAEKHALPFPLLSDPEHVVLGPWGVWGKKKLYGKEYEGIVRTTVLFDAHGRVSQVWSPVKVAGHVDAVVAAARALVTP